MDVTDSAGGSSYPVVILVCTDPSGDRLMLVLRPKVARNLRDLLSGQAADQRSTPT